MQDRSSDFDVESFSRHNVNGGGGDRRHNQ